MSGLEPSDPPRLLDGGLVDGDAPSPELLEMLRVLRADAAITPAPIGGGRGRWLVLVSAVAMIAASSVPSEACSEPTSATRIAPAVSAGDASPARALALTVDTQASAPRASGSRAPAPARSRAAPRVSEPPAVFGPAPAPVAVTTPPRSRVLAPAPAPAASTPSAEYAGALADYARDCCPCALPQLERVVEGETDDPPAFVQRAELLLGVCLARTDWPIAAVSVLDQVVRTPAHPHAAEALRELSRLAERLPDPSVLVDTFRLDDEVRLAGEDPTPASAAAAYLQGRARYEDADSEAAVRLFARVPESSSFYLPARFYQGTAEVRLRHAQRAIEAFRDVERRGQAEHSRYADLAALALARTYYAVANGRHDAGDDARAAELMTTALDAWGRVPLTSEHFLDAFFEESWALALAGQDERALGHVFGLLSPFFDDHEHPEALVVRGTIYYQHCLCDSVENAVHDFHARYDAPLEELASARARAEDDDAARALHDGGGDHDPVTRAIVRDALVDRDVARRIAHEDAARAELARIDHSVHARTRLGERLAHELALTASFAHVRVADAIRARLSDAHDSLVARANEIDTLALETATARRSLVMGTSTLAEDGLAHEREVIASEGVEYWPFDGEYWEDEVTSYRVVLHDRCGR